VVVGHGPRAVAVAEGPLAAVGILVDVQAAMPRRSNLEAAL
jgi:hypothetical protein